MGELVRVLVVDDQALVRAGFRMICEAESDLTVVGEAADGAAAVELAGRAAPDVVLMDIRMPVMDGVEACRHIVSAGTSVRVLVLTTFDLDDYVYAALRAGASGFLLKDTPPEQLVEGIRIIAGGDALLGPSITRRVIETFATTSPVPATPSPLAGLNTLTEREHEVLGLMARGLSNAEIAAALFLGEATVKTHVGRVLMKLDLRDRVQAVVVAYEHGIVTPGTAAG